MKNIDIATSPIVAEVLAAQRLVDGGRHSTFESALAHVRKHGTGDIASAVRAVDLHNSAEVVSEAQRLVAIGAQPNLDVAREAVRAGPTADAKSAGGVTGKISRVFSELFEEEPQLLKAEAEARQTLRELTDQINQRRNAAIGIVTGREEKRMRVEAHQAQLQAMVTRRERMVDRRAKIEARLMSKLRNSDAHHSLFFEMALESLGFAHIISSLDTLIREETEALKSARADLDQYLDQHAAELELVERV